MRIVQGVDHGDQDSSQELPQRARGVARAGPPPSAPPALSDEVRQRMQAAVLAERADAAQQDADAPTGPEPKVTRPGRATAVNPVGNGISRPAQSAVRPDPVKPDSAANGSASHKPAAPVRAGAVVAVARERAEEAGRRRIGKLAAIAVILPAALGAMASWYFTRTPQASPLLSCNSRS